MLCMLELWVTIGAASSLDDEVLDLSWQSFCWWLSEYSRGISYRDVKEYRKGNHGHKICSERGSHCCFNDKSLYGTKDRVY